MVSLQPRNSGSPKVATRSSSSDGGKPRFLSAAMSAVTERNRFTEIVFAALLLSASLRIWLDLRLHAPRAASLPCHTDGSLQLTDQSVSATSAYRNDSVVALPGRAWRLPAGVARSYGGLGGGKVDPARFRLHVKVLVFDRPAYALRCLRALADALYDAEPVYLDVFVDHPFALRADAAPWSPRTARRVAASHSLMAQIDAFAWPHGPKRVMYRSQSAGLQGQWVEAWWPESLADVALIVEDHVVVSPLYYRYLKRLLARYYFRRGEFDPHMLGVSLQRQSFVPGLGGDPLPPLAHSAPFLYTLTGTWGQALLPGPWQQFRVWLDERRYNGSRQPTVGGTEDHAVGNRRWSPWAIKWAYSHAMLSLYPPLPANLSLAFPSSAPHPPPTPPSCPCCRGWAHLEGGHSWGGTGAALRPVCAPAEAPARGAVAGRSALAAGRHAPGQARLAGGGAAGIQGPAQQLALPPGRQRPALIRPHRPHASLAAELSARGLAAFHLPPISRRQAAQGLGSWQRGRDAQGLIPADVDMWGHLNTADVASSYFVIRSRAATVSAWGQLAKLCAQASKGGAKGGMDRGEVGCGEPGSGVQQRQMRVLLTQAMHFKEVPSIPFTRDGAARVPKGTLLPALLPPQSLTKGGKVKAMDSIGLWVIDDFDLACKAVTCKRRLYTAGSD
ncbi:hypothetical protein CLOP_g22072 [Closterium sp. NIES-67]|nr:hypothetical protein CLOP_g22072 [Closterium sp. NIES-67]